MESKCRFPTSLVMICPGELVLMWGKVSASPLCGGPVGLQLLGSLQYVFPLAPVQKRIRAWAFGAANNRQRETRHTRDAGLQNHTGRLGEVVCFIEFKLTYYWFHRVLLDW